MSSWISACSKTVRVALVACLCTFAFVAAAQDGPARASDRSLLASATLNRPNEVSGVRRIRLSLPTRTMVGSNVTGFMQVVDISGLVATPVEGLTVVLQEKVGGTTRFTDSIDGLTDANGLVSISFTSRSNTQWRAYVIRGGNALYSPTVSMTASAHVTWAARPRMRIKHNFPVRYSFRISPAAVGTAHLEMANAKSPKRWISAKAVMIPVTGVVTQVVKFPSAGVWRLRGSTTATARNAAGRTTLLTIRVT